METLKRLRSSRQDNRQLSSSTPEPPTSADLRPLFAGQARLLAERSERGLPIDVRSLFNLAFAYVAITEAESDDGDVVA